MTRRRSQWILAAFFLLLATISGFTAAKADWKESRDAGQKALAAGDLDTAEEQMKQAIVSARKLGPDHELELVEAFVGLSDVYLKQARMTEASILLEHSLLLLAQTPGAPSRVLDQLYSNLATVRIFQKNLPEAESLLRRALTTREKRLGREHVDVAEVLDRLADLAIEQKNAEDALALHGRALAIREKAAGGGAVDLIKALNQGADWYEDRGYEDQSEAVWRRLLPIQEKTLGLAHRDVADTLMKIIAHRLHLGSSGGLSMSVDITSENLFPSEQRKAMFRDELLASFRDHEPMLARALAIREQALGPDDDATLKVIQYLAAGYELRADWARAVPLFRRLLAAREKTLGPEHPELTRALAVLAGRAMVERRYQDAIPLLKRLTAIEAAERAKAPKEDDPLAFFPLSEMPSTIDLFKENDPSARLSLIATIGGVEEDDPNDTAALLRKAIRLADLEQNPEARPTQQDLDFFMSEGWRPPATDVSALLDLTSVVLQNARVDNASLGHLRGLVNLKSPVVNPILMKNARPNIDDAGLVQLHNLSALKKIDLQGTAIRGPGLSVLARMSELRYLDISFTLLDDAGLATLPDLPNLEHLDLSSTAVSDRSVPILKKLSGLKALHIFGTQISDQGAADLRKTMPGVRVFGPGLAAKVERSGLEEPDRGERPDG